MLPAASGKIRSERTLAASRSRLLGAVLAADAEQHEQPGADLADESRGASRRVSIRRDVDARPDDPLHERAHRRRVCHDEVYA